MIFDCVLCAVDPSEESLEAVRQGARLAAPDGRLLLVAVAELEVAVQAGFAAATVAEELQADAEQALDTAGAAIAEIRSAETRLVEGPVCPSLVDEVERERATLLCLGTHGHGRAAGILLASTATTLIHEAPCAVLVARPPADPARFPSSLVAGLDGSPQSDLTASVGSELAARFDVRLRSIVASRGKAVEVDEVRRQHPEVEAVDLKPVDALIEASAQSDIVLVGSSGRHGVRALGSVSERVAHQARCSVLIVRQG